VQQGVSRWAFSQKVGAVSDPYTIPGGYAVFHLADVKDAGVRPLDEVKDNIRPLALREKKIEKVTAIAADLRSKLGQGDSLTKAQSLNPAVVVQELPSFTLGGAVPGIGRDAAFLGTVAALHPGQISPATKNMRGAFLVQLLSVSPFDSTGLQRSVTC
jgi:hypothetical protein